MRLLKLIGVLASLTMVAGCSSAAPTARFTDIKADSGVTVWTELEVQASSFGDPRVVGAVEQALGTLAADMKSGKVKPGPAVKYVQALIFVKTTSEPHEKLGLVRFPVREFVAADGGLDAAEFVQMSGFGAGRNFCNDAANRARPFCVTAEADWI